MSRADVSWAGNEVDQLVAGAEALCIGAEAGNKAGVAAVVCLEEVPTGCGAETSHAPLGSTASASYFDRQRSREFIQTARDSPASILPSDRARLCHAPSRTLRAQRTRWLVHGEIAISRCTTHLGSPGRVPLVTVVRKSERAWTSRWTSSKGPYPGRRHIRSQAAPEVPESRAPKPLAARPSALACAGRAHARPDSAVQAPAKVIGGRAGFARGYRRMFSTHTAWCKSPR
ncbi:hypothetical protein B0H14DRAFT_2802327 [Mycena olivaceomarginata]|nr:hypothetical protein B0H14DRAFT_2802327 [Mycena olivaceomarginata]